MPTHPHGFHNIRAGKVDRLALKLLTVALTKPEHILKLADTAEQQYAQAMTDTALAEARLAASDKHLTEISAAQDKRLAAQDAPSGVPGMGEQINGIRARLAKLDAEREQAEEERTQGIPSHDRAVERQTFLRTLFTHRAKWVNFDTGETGYTGESRLAINSLLHLDDAAALLGIPEAEVAQRLPVRPPEPIFINLDDGTTEEIEEYPATVERSEVIYSLLQHASRARVRKLMDDLKAVVLVQRPRTREEWATYGPTPPEERVSLRLLGTVEIRIDAANVL